jgi:hypothetical protein
MSNTININGINEVDFTLGGTTTAVISSPGVVAITNVPPITVVFSISNGATGTSITLLGVAPRAGSVVKCVVVVTASDGSTALTFRIKQNGTDVFLSDPTISAGTAAGTVVTFTNLTSVPLSIATNDVFSMDITSGTGSWKFTAQLE